MSADESEPLDDDLNALREEIEGLHAFFCVWFGGRVPESVFEADFEARFSSDLVFIPPAGSYLGLPELSAAIRNGYGSNPDFRVEIRNVTIVKRIGSHALVTYEEWQRNALASTPPDNGRVATALFDLGPPLRWLHIHETWLPRELMDQDNFDF